MGQIEDIFGGMFDACRNTSEYKDRSSMINIIFQRQEFEKNLDDMWVNYMRGNPAQLVEYNKGLDQIKSCGLKVLRNSAGKHKIVVPK